MSGPVTIGDLMRDHRLLWVYCRECGRERDLDPSTLPLPGALLAELVRSARATMARIG